HEPVSCDTFREGARIAFGQRVDAVYQFALADVVVAADADFLGQGPAAVRYARDFMSRRENKTGNISNRLYSLETMYTPTGAAADHRLPLKPGDVELFIRSLAGRWGIVDASSQDSHRKWVD